METGRLREDFATLEEFLEYCRSEGILDVRIAEIWNVIGNKGQGGNSLICEVGKDGQITGLQAYLYIQGTPAEWVIKNVLLLFTGDRLSINTDLLNQLPETFPHADRLRRLDLICGELQVLPDWFTKENRLNFLLLAHLPFSKIPSEWLGKLQQLTSLWLYEIECLRHLPSGVSTLKKLKTLALHNCYRIKKLPEGITRLRMLECLFLDGTDIETLPKNISKLQKLRSLSLSYTPISKLPESICHLPSLSDLRLKNCHLETLPKDILNLKLPFNEGGPKGINISGLVVDTFDVQALIGKNEEELALFFENLQQEAVSTNEVRVIFIGNGDVGKSTVIHKLVKGRYKEGLGCTRGVEITPWEVPLGGETVLLNLWDFGGQDIMHSMHTYFMGERCLYVVMLDGRRDETPEQWLDLVRQYGRRSAVLVVQNKVDQANPAIDEQKLRGLYEKSFPYLSFHRISCKKGTNFRAFQEDLLRAVTVTESYKQGFPGTWDRVRRKLRDMRDEMGAPLNYISIEKYESLCAEEITDRTEQGVLLGWLHDMGVCFNYNSRNHSGAVEATKVLRPEWITNGVYKIINSKQAARSNGFISHAVIKRILEEDDGVNPLYKNVERDFILNMMREFEYSYAVGNREFFPMLTNVSQPADLPMCLFEEGTVRYRFHYTDLLPPAVLYNFIVRMQEDAETALTWRRGAVLVNGSCTAMVAFGKDNHVLDLAVYGPHDEACGYLTRLVGEIRRTQAKLNLQYDEYVLYRLADGGVAPIDFNRMLDMLAQGYPSDYIKELGTSVLIQDVLRSVRPQAVIDSLYLRLEEIRAEKDTLLRERGYAQQIMRSIEQIEGTIQRLARNTEQLNALVKQNHTALLECVVELKTNAGERREMLLQLDDIADELQKHAHKRAGRKVLDFVGDFANIAAVASTPAFITLLQLLQLQ